MKDAKHARNREPDLSFGHIAPRTNPASVSKSRGEGVHWRELLSVNTGVHETIGIEARWFRERFWVMKNCPESPVRLSAQRLDIGCAYHVFPTTNVPAGIKYPLYSSSWVTM